MVRPTASEAFYAAFHSYRSVSCPARRFRSPYARHLSVLHPHRAPAAHPVERQVQNLPVRVPLYHFNKDTISAYPKFHLQSFIKTMRVSQEIANDERRWREGAAELKRNMRFMPHSTVLVTALKTGEWDRGDEDLSKSTNLSPFYLNFRGAVVSSMTSVTLGPPAIISFNLRKPSATLEGILGREVFSIHILEANADGAEVASLFLRHSGDHNAAWKEVARRRHTSMIKSFEIFATPKNVQRLTPVIQGAGIASTLVCKVLPDKCVTVGDHMVVIAEIMAPSWRPSKVDSEIPAEDEARLMYSGGQFREHGPSIAMPDPESQDAEPSNERNVETPHFDLHKVPDDTPPRSFHQCCFDFVARGETSFQGTQVADAVKDLCESVLHSGKESEHIAAALVLHKLNHKISKREQVDTRDIEITDDVRALVDVLGVTLDKAPKEERVRVKKPGAKTLKGLERRLDVRGDTGLGPVEENPVYSRRKEKIQSGFVEEVPRDFTGGEKDRSRALGKIGEDGEFHGEVIGMGEIGDIEEAARLAAEKYGAVNAASEDAPAELSR